MDTFFISAAHLTGGIYTGGDEVENFNGHIVLGEDLGRVIFPGCVKAVGRIEVRSGSAIRASGNISAGWSILSNGDISAVRGISATGDISVEESIISDGGDIAACGEIRAGGRILAEQDITAHLSISAGSGIEAGNGILSRKSVSSGLAIDAKWISARDRIFAGTCLWRLPKPEEMEVRAEIRSGLLVFGIHVPPTH